MTIARPRRRPVLLALLALAGWGGEAACREHPLAAGLPLSFDSEWIRLAVIGDSLEVRGTYVLLCREVTDAPFPLFYPFPYDASMGGARMVSLWESASRGDLKPLRWDEIEGVDGVRWWLPPCSGDTLRVEAVYRQALTTGYARYIVTTARLWGSPLRRARFDVRLPPGAVPVDFSFPFTRRETGGDLFYSFVADSFFPERDIIVRWRP